MIVERSFTMPDAAESAQARFRAEIAPALHRMGFTLAEDEPGRLAFGVRHLGGYLLASVLTVSYWLSRLARRQRLEVDFHPDNAGTRVVLYGQVSRGVATQLGLLGCHGHWPENRDDPGWHPAADEDPYAEWDDLPEPAEMDRITRRALRHAGRL